MSIGQEAGYLVQFHPRLAAMRLGNPEQLDNNAENFDVLTRRNRVPW